MNKMLKLKNANNSEQCFKPPIKEKHFCFEKINKDIEISGYMYSFTTVPLDDDFDIDLD